MTTAKRHALIVYTIVQREREPRRFWRAIGTAFRNHDGSLSAYLDAVPVNGTLHIRESRPGEVAVAGPGHRSTTEAGAAPDMPQPAKTVP